MIGRLEPKPQSARPTSRPPPILADSLGHVSGGHFNPAVTISLLISGNCGVVQAVANICAQLLGATTAAGFLYG